MLAPSVVPSLKFKCQLEGAFHSNAELLKELLCYANWKEETAIATTLDAGDVELPLLSPSP